MSILFRTAPGDSTPRSCSDLHWFVSLPLVPGTSFRSWWVHWSSQAAAAIQGSCSKGFHQPDHISYPDSSHYQEKAEEHRQEKKCNQEKGELLFLVETVKNHHLGRAKWDTLGQPQQSTKNQAGESLEREMVEERPKAVLRALKCSLLYAQQSTVH